MTITDIITLIGIVVSIIFGFFVTHFYSVQDARTRVLKDFHIEEIKIIKRRIDSFFHNIAFGQYSFKDVVKWYNHLIMDINAIDDGVRTHLDLHIDEITDHIERYYYEITSWDDFNNQYANSHYIPSTINRQRLVMMKYECDAFLNRFINHVNQANNYPIWTVQLNRIKENIDFYKGIGRKNSWLLAIWERIEKHLFEIMFIITIPIVSILLIPHIKKEEKEDLITPIQNISEKHDSIHKEIQLLRTKYKPIEVQTKTFNNSSFFNANQVDSVHIKLYQGTPQE